MKRIILTFILMFLLVGCSVVNYDKINCDKLIKKLENKETFILLVYNDSDESKLLENTLSKVLEDNDLEAYTINSNSISEEKENELRKYFSYENISIIFFKDGVDPSKLSHITDTSITSDKLEKHLINLGFIQSDDTEKTSK